MTAKHSVSVAGAVIDGHGRVLAIRRDDNGHWEPPGGVLELGETFEDGVRREIAEETGMTVGVEALSGVYKNMNRAIVALVFRCRPAGEPVQRTAEAREIRWMARDEVADNMAPAYAARLLDAFDPETNYRTHDGVNVTSP